MRERETLIDQEEEKKLPSSRFNIILEKQEVVQLTTVPGAKPSDNLMWESADEEIAKVNTIGTVTAIAIGRTQIHVENETLTFEDYINIKVVDQGEARDLRLAIQLKVGEFIKLSLEDAEYPVWESLDTSVAIVSETGEVTGISEGMALITATYGEEVNVIYVIVEKLEEEVIAPVEENEVTAYSGFTLDLDGSSKNENGEVDKVLITVPFKNKSSIPKVFLNGDFSVLTGTETIKLSTLEPKTVAKNSAVLEGTLEKPYAINSPVVLVLNNMLSRITIKGKGGI